jgi:tRNA A37 threonylcarbamoyladenosine dehydratase
VIDAIDTISSKIDLVLRCKAEGVPIISSMGAGNKMDPAAFKVGDIYETSIDPIAKVMRRELRKRGVRSLKVVYSTETPTKPGYPDGGSDSADEEGAKRRRNPPGSISFVPPVAGLIMAAEVIKDIIDWPRN